jgi:hypothetical protein
VATRFAGNVERAGPSMTKPNRVRVVLEEYDSRRRGYREIRSIPGVPIYTKREMNRLWSEIGAVVEDRDWTDRNVARAEAPDEPQV